MIRLITSITPTPLLTISSVRFRILSMRSIKVNIPSPRKNVILISLAIYLLILLNIRMFILSDECS